MKKLLFSLGSLVLVATSGAPVMAMSQNYTNNAVRSAIDLAGIDIKSTTVNVNDLYGEDYTIEDIQREVYTGILSANQDNDDVKTLIVDILTGGTDVLVSGIPTTIPPPSGEGTYLIHFTCIGGDQFAIGSVASVSVTLTNIKQGKDISEVIDAELFKNITFDVTTLSETTLNEVLIENFNVDLDSIHFENFSYNSVKVVANEDGIYSGFVCLIINVASSLHVGLYSGSASADAYNSTQEDSISDTFSLNIQLGKEAFLTKFSSADFHITGRATNNSSDDRTKSFDVTNSLDGDLELNDFYTLMYNGAENWMKSYCWYGFSWLNTNDDDVSNDVLQLEAKASVTVHATAWNAMWARATAQSWINDIDFN
jgi:hypothetical protein